MLAPIRSTSSVAVVTPDRSISSRVTVCSGATPSASVRGMFEPVIITRCGVWSCCAHADETVNAEATPAANAMDIDAATERRALVVFIFPPPQSEAKQLWCFVWPLTRYGAIRGFMPFDYTLLQKWAKYAHTRRAIAISIAHLKQRQVVVHCTKRTPLHGAYNKSLPSRDSGGRYDRRKINRFPDSASVDRSVRH